MGIPTIDISLFYEFDDLADESLYSDPAAERRKAINALLNSASTYGAFKITGHDIPGSTIQRVFESSVEFFDLHKHIKKSAAGPRLKNGRLRGYRGPEVTDRDTSESFVIGPTSDRQAPTPWPVGVRGDILQMKMQPFSRDCANLHHDLLHILEEALELWNNELLSRWPAPDGEVHCEYNPAAPRTTSTTPTEHLERLVSQVESQGARTMLALAFQDNASEEVVVVCGSTVRKWIQVRLGPTAGKSRSLQIEEDGQPTKYSVSYVGYEDTAAFVT
ncbi:hypothetical protein PG984_003645 [Apiospora sp. TS-2023a]